MGSGTGSRILGYGERYSPVDLCVQVPGCAGRDALDYAALQISDEYVRESIGVSGHKIGRIACKNYITAIRR